MSVVVGLADLVSGGPGQLANGTPVPARAVERLSCDSELHRIVMSGRSTVLDYGSSVRTISPALWAALVVRDRHCRHPGCDRPPSWCDAHHIVHFAKGGADTFRQPLARLHTPSPHLARPGLGAHIGPRRHGHVRVAYRACADELTVATGPGRSDPVLKDPCPRPLGRRDRRREHGGLRAYRLFWWTSERWAFGRPPLQLQDQTIP